METFETLLPALVKKALTVQIANRPKSGPALVGTAKIITPFLFSYDPSKKKAYPTKWAILHRSMQAYEKLTEGPSHWVITCGKIRYDLFLQAVTLEAAAQEIAEGLEPILLQELHRSLLTLQSSYIELSKRTGLIDLDP